MIHRAVVLALAMLVLSACSDDPVSTNNEPTPQQPPALSAGSWELALADGQALPALVAHRQVDGVLEQTFVDSARLEIEANGLFTQKIWTTTLRGGALFQKGGLSDLGIWRAEQDRYRLTSAMRTRSLTLRNNEVARLDLVEPIVIDRPDAGLVVSQYRPRSTPT